MMKTSIIIPSFKRAHLLQWNLFSLAKQSMSFDFETIILNDGVLDGTEDLCSQYKERLNIKYFFTGQRNTGGQSVWRVPGFAINIGVRKSSGDIILLCCAEMFHVNETIKLITDVYNSPNSDKVLAIPKAKDDNGGFLKRLEISNGDFSIEEYNKQPRLKNIKLPFFMAMRRNEFMDIGGYDEDFTGVAYEDTDLMERLVGNGCYHVETEALTMHLWHPRLPMSHPRVKYNKELCLQRRNTTVRNTGREWGVLL